MSLKTRSGLPAFDATTMEQARLEQMKFHEALSHLHNCSDYDRLLIPSAKTFLKFDVQNPIHPVAHAIRAAVLAEKDDDDMCHKLQGRLETGEITQARFDWEMKRIELSRLERKYEFDKNSVLKREIKMRKKHMRPFVEPKLEFD